MQPASTMERGLQAIRKAWAGLGVGFLACLAIILFNPGGQIDRTLSDKLLRTGEQAAAPDILLIEISPRDIVNYGRPMLSRENLARMLDMIADAGPERVLLDLHIAAEAFPESDSLLEQSLERLGPGRIGLVTAPLPTDLPPQRFAQHGTIVDARLTPDADGWHRQLGRDGRVNGFNAARWLGTGELSDKAIPLDLRIADANYETADVTDVLEGRVALADRRIVISSSTLVATSRATLPRSESTSRAVVLAVAAQSAQENYAAHLAKGKIGNLVLQFLAIVLGILCARHASSGIRLFVLAGAAVMAITLAHMSLANRVGAPVSTVVALSCFAIMLNYTLVRRFRIAGLMSNFLRGDLSPEEAWAWRASEGGNAPAVLFAADGRIKRANASAKDICRLFAAELAPLCLPRPGERADEIRLQDEAGRRTWFRVDWPFDQLPIAVMHDVTDVKLREEALLSQLNEDVLTGSLNRRGFDDAIGALAAEGSHYSVLYIDLNGFKSVNDTHGHDAGDEVLCHVAKVLSENVRQGDSVARLGGDEFAVVMPGRISTKRLETERERIIGELGRPLSLTCVDTEVSIGAAIGYAHTRRTTDLPKDVLRRADQMMYDRKVAMKRERLAA